MYYRIEHNVVAPSGEWASRIICSQTYQGAGLEHFYFYNETHAQEALHLIEGKHISHWKLRDLANEYKQVIKLLKYCYENT